jgi:hypothetical protein
MKLSGILALMLVGVTASVGCQSNPATVRGQNPMGPPSAGQPMMPAPGPVYYEGPAGGSMPGCPPCHNHPLGAQCPICAPDNFWVPKHHHTYDYRIPKNLVYPPQNQPAGVVVYPYYTCKGPSDFFMK